MWVVHEKHDQFLQSPCHRDYFVMPAQEKVKITQCPIGTFLSVHRISTYDTLPVEVIFLPSHKYSKCFKVFHRVTESLAGRDMASLQKGHADIMNCVCPVSFFPKGGRII